MRLSRSEHRRRVPALSPLRWTLLIAGFLVFAIVTFVLYVRNADGPYRQEERTAIAEAKQEGGLVSTDEAIKHVWDQVVWVVRGKDQAEVPWYVWIRKDGSTKEKATDGLTEDQAKEHFMTDHPQSIPVRMILGWYSNQPAWEIRYKANEQSTKEALVFYSFKEGTLLGNFELTN